MGSTQRLELGGLLGMQSSKIIGTFPEGIFKLVGIHNYIIYMYQINVLSDKVELFSKKHKQIYFRSFFHLYFGCDNKIKAQKPCCHCGGKLYVI